MHTIDNETLIAAIAEAMEDRLENSGVPTPHNPAIMIDGDGWCYYGSALHGDAVVYDCAGGFDSYEPDNEGQVPDCAKQLAAEIEAGYTVPPRRGAEGRKR